MKTTLRQSVRKNLKWLATNRGWLMDNGIMHKTPERLQAVSRIKSRMQYCRKSDGHIWLRMLLALEPDIKLLMGTFATHSFLKKRFEIQQLLEYAHMQMSTKTTAP